MEDYVQAALGSRLPSMTFLEHLECDIIYSDRTWLTHDHFVDYFKEGQRLKKTYGDSIKIQLGVELGYNPTAVVETTDFLNKFPFEHIGLSYHFYFDGNKHLNMFSKRQHNITKLTETGTENILNEYFTGLLDAISLLPCDKVCHLDAALRHVPDISLTAYHHHQITTLLDTMKEKNIALEINTSGYEHRSHPYPMENIIRQAATKQIPLIAGSDAHRPEQVGRFFDRLHFV